MTRRAGASGRVAVALFACFCVGVTVGWQLRGGPLKPAGGDPVASAAVPAGNPVVFSLGRPETNMSRMQPDGTSTASAPNRAGDAAVEIGAGPSSAIDALHHRDLRIPIDGATVESMRGGFAERRDAGGRPHEAVDMLAPRNTPVHAVDNGRIAKLFLSKAGGSTIYQFDPSSRFCYYYAHLERYADGLREGAPVSRDDVIGFVGTSGNAPPNTPHLHFGIFELTPDHHWWQGTAVDPYLAFQR